jgi:hypothetical protein
MTLVINDPELPVFDLDVLETSTLIPADLKYARETAARARRLGLADIAERLEEFADAHGQEEHDGR